MFPCQDSRGLSSCHVLTIEEGQASLCQKKGSGAEPHSIYLGLLMKKTEGSLQCESIEAQQKAETEQWGKLQALCRYGYSTNRKTRSLFIALTKTKLA